MPATLRDVADRAGVSIRTVSNVVSGYEHVSARMRERVMAAIAELDYRPNPVARTLRTGRTGVLALVVPEIDVPYFSQLARDVIDAAAQLGFRVMIDQTGHDHARERQLLLGEDRTMLFDGILFSPLVTRAELLEM
jgi:DNA-binding LacI/PurR family transcriptional regulator